MGDLTIVPSQNIASLGPCDGKPVVVSGCVLDTLQSVFLWVIFLLILHREYKRDRRAWTIIIPILILTLTLSALARILDSYFLYYWHKELTLIIVQSLQFFALGTGILLLLGPRLTVHRRLLQFLIKFGVLLGAGTLGIVTNAWPGISSGVLVILFAGGLLLVLAGYALAGSIIQRFFPARFKTAFVLCGILAPTLPLGVLWLLDLTLTNTYQCTLETFRLLSLFLAVFFGPGLVLAAFMILASKCPFYADRFKIHFRL